MLYVTYVLRTDLPVYFDACHFRASKFPYDFANLKQEWTIYQRFPDVTPLSDQMIHKEFSGCRMEWTAPQDGNYSVKLTLQDPYSATPKSEIHTPFFVKDLWMAAMGDSYVSGQGNPDISSRLFGLVPAKWIDPGCFRSAKSFAYHTYQKILRQYPDYGIVFSFLACSGASILNGILDCVIPRLTPQVTALENLIYESRKDCSFHCQTKYTPHFCRSCMHQPDVVLLGVGGNDVNYEKIATKMFLGNPYKEFLSMPDRLRNLSSNMDRLHERLTELKIQPKSIFYTEYFDPLRNDRGKIDADCEKTGLASTWDFYLADKTVRRPINNLISDQCEKCGWTKIDGIDEMFATHGICARNSFIRSLTESLKIQANHVGAFHPNEVGHKAISEYVWYKLKPYLEQRISQGHHESPVHSYHHDNLIRGFTFV